MIGGDADSNITLQERLFGFTPNYPIFFIIITKKIPFEIATLPPHCRKLLETYCLDSPVDPFSHSIIMGLQIIPTFKFGGLKP